MATGMDFSALLSQIDKVTTKKNYDDEKVGYWKPTRDKTGNGSAKIRFLPNKDITDFPFVRMWSHSFKNEETGRWYIENSLSTIGEQDYIAELNHELWNTNLDENKEIVRKRKRKLHYISNILVISDTANPENNGKVFKFSYGTKIFDKIVAAAKPTEGELDEDNNPIVPVNAFDPEDGADFMLRIKTVEKFPNYDDSRFTKKKALFGGDEDEIKAVLDKCFDLNLEVAPDKFKTKEELEKKFKWVMGEDSKSKSKDKTVDAELDSLANLAKSEPKKAKKADDEAPKAEKAKADKPKPPMPTASSDDSDDAFFAGLLED